MLHISSAEWLYSIPHFLPQIRRLMLPSLKPTRVTESPFREGHNAAADPVELVHDGG